MTDELPDGYRERNNQRQRELARADPIAELMKAEHYQVGHPMRDSHERVALVSAVMLLTHRVGELARIVGRQKTESRNGDGPHE